MLSDESRSLRRIGSGLQVNVLLLCEAHEFVDAFFSPDAGAPIAAKGRSEVVRTDGVDPYIARARSVCRAANDRHIARPDRTGQAKVDAIDFGPHGVLIAP